MKKVVLVLFIVLFPLVLNAWNPFSDKKNPSDISEQNSIAIGKFQLKGNTSQSQYAEFLSDFRSYIDDSFSKYANFKVINKSRVDEVMGTNGMYKEQTGFDLKNFEFTKEKVKKYKQFNAEYVLLGEIKNFSLDKLRGSKLNNGEIATLSKKQMVADVNVSIALVHVVTQEVVAKETLQIKKLLEDSSDSSTLITTAMKLTADDLVSKLLLSMTKEIKVISVQDNEVVLNKGSKNGIKEGMSFELYKTKKIETYTTQIKVATVKIKRVDNEISFASLENIIELPKSGNLAKFVETNKQAFTKEKIRVAIGETIIERSNIKNSVLERYINSDMEYAFSQNSTFVVTNNNKSQTNKILAQQILDELSKGRETGLPLGSLRGVDYLIFNTIDYVKFNEKKVKLEYIKSIDVLDTKIKKPEAKLVGYVYLIDVNTANKVASVPVEITHQFSPKENTFEIMMKELSQKFVKKASQEIFKTISPLRIINIAGLSVVLNGGKGMGVNIGDIFTVYSLGKRVIDNRTGQNIDMGGIPIAKIRIDSFNNKDLAIGTIIQGNVNQTGLEVKLEFKSKESRQVVDNEETYKPSKATTTKSGKKYIAIKDILIDETIDKYKHEYLNEARIDTKIKESINKSKIFRTLSRDREQIKHLMMERQIAQSDISDKPDEDSMRLSLADYILIPKVTKFKLGRSSKKIEYIDSFENRDFIEMELSLTLLSKKGEVIFNSLKSDKYTKSWASDNKLKSRIPSRKNIFKLTNKVVEKAVNDVINNKLEITSDGVLTVVDVGKMTIFVDLANQKDVVVGDEFYVYPEPKVKEMSRTGKKRLSYGSRVAQVKIDAIFDDGAEAVVTQGDIEDIKENFILRKKH